MYGNWTNAAMALHRMEGAEKRFADAKTRGEQLFTELNKTGRFNIKPLDNGTNIYRLSLAKNIDGKNLQNQLNQQFNIRIPRPDNNNKALIAVNETILNQPLEYLINSFSKTGLG